MLCPVRGFSAQAAIQGRDCFNRWGSDTALWVCGHQQVSPARRGHVAARVQALVVRLPGGVVVVDPGATYRQGRALARDLAGVFPAQQYWILNSRAQADHVMASDGLRQGLLRNGIPAHRISVLSGAVTQGLMSQRCPDCLQRLQRELGPHDMRGTDILIPAAEAFSAPLKGALSDDLVFSLTHGLAFSEDLLLRHVGAQWRWLGVLVDDRLPDLQQGSVQERLNFLKMVQADHTVRWLLGSFGEVQQTQIAVQVQYFELLAGAAAAALEGGADSIAALSILRQLPAWPAPLSDLEKRTHELNLQRLVRQAEEALF